jgi:hypothetical protein
VASAVCASVLVATGCASAGNPPDRVVGDFAAAVGRGDGSEACRLLAPSTRSELEQSAGTPCATALLDEVDEDMGEALSAGGYGDQVFSIYLRQRGSPESKPVGAPHDATGQTG